MSDNTPQTPPPLPEQPAAEAAAAPAPTGAFATRAEARSAPAGAVGGPGGVAGPADATAPMAAEPTPARTAAPAYNPMTDPDDTGVPRSLDDDVTAVGRGFFAALFDISFRTFITRRLATAFYVVGLVAIGIGFLVYFIGGIARSIGVMPFNLGAGLSLLIATLIIVPIVTFLAIVVLRFIIEAVVALIAIAENTQQTADNTEK